MNRQELFRQSQHNAFINGGKSNYLKALYNEYQIKEKTLLLRLQTAEDESERDSIAKAIEELGNDYKSKVSNAKRNLYVGHGRFSLRTLLVTTALVAFAVGLVAWLLG